MGFPGGASGKEPACQCRRHPSLGGEDPLEKGMATHCSILAWRILRTEEPAGPQPMGRKESDMTELLNSNKVYPRLPVDPAPPSLG